ncbi:tannase [Enterococcus hulanensis]|uniref:subtype B tannase n=1 Tax=Enterococcus hulanensis TaxID=2559929 RepID=UPI001A905FC8|nr:subtype B tannase [Enterococcus hulanensis]MBO0457390.1 tannase [Enterococcus hulanensis]
MSDKLRLPTEQYVIKTCEQGGRKITYRAFENLSYCEKPVDLIQKLSIYVPEDYYHGLAIGAYDRSSAPIFMPNTVGGYLPGPVDEPGEDRYSKNVNSIFLALEHGYVVVTAGVRGRTSGRITADFFEGGKEEDYVEATGHMVGRAPALIVDYKAAIRYLRYNKHLIPGDTERIITNGTSAGGALSALAGATGNSPDYDSYLAEIGAADERDDIFAVSSYCPIHNLENADSAYEWLFSGQKDYYRTKHLRTDNGIIRVPDDGQMTDQQLALSRSLKALFPAYVNRLGLTDEAGEILTLDEDGEGSFKEFVKEELLVSANKELQTHENESLRTRWMMDGSEIDTQSYFTVADNHVIDLDWDTFVTKITRMKAAPAFDAVDLTSPENEEFGNEQIDSRHFTAFSMEHSRVPDAELADDMTIRLLNPTVYIRENKADIAKHWRIRHGSFDRDTSLAIPVILATLLKNKGYDVDFELPWGIYHCGDYDLAELFKWIDELCLSYQSNEIV